MCDKVLALYGFLYYAEVRRDRGLSCTNGNEIDVLELRHMCWMERTGTSNFVITSPSNLLIEQHLYKGWKKCLSCLLFRYWSKTPAYYLVIQTYSFWISQTFLKVCNKSLIFGFRLGQAFRFLLFICKLLACFLQFVFQGLFLFGELQQRKKKLCYQTCSNLQDCVILSTYSTIKCARMALKDLRKTARVSFQLRTWLWRNRRIYRSRWTLPTHPSIN